MSDSEMAWLVHLVVLFLLNFHVVLGQKNDIQQSAEYQLRSALLKRYDKMVRPVLKPTDVVNVTFNVELNSLIEVDNKDQVVTTDTVIVQKWNNPYLQWDPVAFGGIQQILVDPKEIWVPDIVLDNNADDATVQAGHLEKFRSWVLVKSDGSNTWLSPATFKSTCKLDVQFFPFDKQRCDMTFRSLTADRSLMDLYTKNIKSDHPEEDLKLSTSNGYWKLRSIEIKTAVYSSSGNQEFREVVVSFFIGRRPTYFVTFSIVPCMIIGMLILVSFFIPVESNARIGLCSTILLAVSVYLLVVTEQLPEQSETLPLIGVYYIVIMFEIGLALTATVLVLMAHHATSEPPRFLTYIIVLNRIGCCWKKRQKSVTLGSPVRSTFGAENPGMTPGGNDVEVGGEEKESQDEVRPELHRPSTTQSIVIVRDEDENQKTWKEIARALDRIFFWLFLALVVVSSIVVYGEARRLRSFDSFDD